MSGALEVSDLRVENEAGVLLDVPELILHSGELAVITGPTDSGKTLLASVLCGVASPSAGVIRVRQRRLTGSPSQRRRLGLAGTVADGHRIAGCTVAEALRLAGGPRRAARALDRLQLLAARSSTAADHLSGGEQQLLQVACAWVASAAVLVLDSPTTGLATDAAEVVRRLVVDAALDGTAVLWLDPSSAPPPGTPAWSLDGGVLSSTVPATGSWTAAP